jgi:hypothetical protein
MTFTHQATGRFTVSSWTEETFADLDGEGTTAGETYYPKRGLSHARVGYTYTGDLDGTSVLSYLIAYKPGGAPVLAFEHFTGSVDGHAGSCVFQHVGGQDEGSVWGHLEVVPGMGTGALESLRGAADLRIAGHSEDGYELVLAYDLGRA